MDKYASRHLAVGENLLYEGRLHWIVFLPGVVHLLAGFSLCVAPVSATRNGLIYVGLALMVVGLVNLGRGAILRLTTELVCTNRRVIAKTGLIARNTIELDVGRVEGIRVEQSMLARLFDYGTVVVRGIGGMETHVTHIASPLRFRQAVNATKRAQDNS